MSSKKKYSKDQIFIRPEDKSHPAQLTEIVGAKADKRKDEFRITTKSRGAERQELVENLDKNSAYYNLMAIMERTFGEMKTEILLEERRHVLGTSELYTRFFELPDWLSEEQQRIMVYFLPWQQEIADDRSLIESCFQTALGQPVCLTPVYPQKENMQGTVLDRWVVNDDDSVGGTAARVSTCMQIRIGPVSAEQLPDLIEGTPQRRFLEEVLFPTFLPEDWDWTTTIEVEEDISQFLVKSDNALVFTGTTTYVRAS